MFDECIKLKEDYTKHFGISLDIDSILINCAGISYVDASMEAFRLNKFVWEAISSLESYMLK